MWSKFREIIVSLEIVLLDLVLNVVVILSMKCVAVKGQCKYLL